MAILKRCPLGRENMQGRIRGLPGPDRSQEPSRELAVSFN
jgi:hypothetical protein